MIREAWKWKTMAAVSAAAVVLDQVTKVAVTRHFAGVEGGSVEVLPGWFSIILTHNPGAAWGILGGIQPDALRIAVFVVISIAAVGMVLWLAWKARPDQKLLVWSSALVLGGAIGNLIDRVIHGHVVDFLDVYTHAGWFSGLMETVGKDPCHPMYGCHWPAFNVADIAISVGVVLLGLESFLTRKEKKSEAGQVAAPEADRP